MNWLLTAIGSTSLLMVMSGFQGVSTQPGVRISTADGHGCLSLAGRGFLMNPGVGALTTTAGGTGSMDSDITGFPQPYGDRPG